MMKRIAFYIPFVLAAVLPLWAQPLQTPGEACGYSRYTQQDEMVLFLSQLQQQSKNMQICEVGQTQAVRDLPAQSLLLCVLTAEGIRRPEQLNRSKPTMLLIASQHGNEQSAKEAALAIIRDLLSAPRVSLLDQANFLVMPQVNPYGNRFDVRVNETGLDMNRDHVKLESRGVQAIHKVFRAWMPEVTLDLHERGDNYYRVAQGCVSNINIDPALELFSRQVILGVVNEALQREKFTFREYMVTSEQMPHDASGAQFSAADLAGKQMIMRYSTTDLNDGRNSLGIYQTFSFIQEVASRHDLATLAQRTGWQIHGIRAFIDAVIAHGAEMTVMVHALRRQLLEQAKMYSDSNRVHLKMVYRRDPTQPELRLEEFKRTEKAVAGILKVDKKAGETVLASEMEPWTAPGRQTVVTRIEKNWYPLVAAAHSVARPLGYVIPAVCHEVVETLRRHDVELLIFTRDAEVEVEGYLVHRSVAAKQDYLPPDTLDVTAQKRSVLCRKGDFYIPCSQPAANLLPCLLEPESDYGLIRYWKYKLLPQAHNYYLLSRVVSAQNLPVIPRLP